jgi:hypothetical protein
VVDRHEGSYRRIDDVETVVGVRESPGYARDLESVGDLASVVGGNGNGEEYTVSDPRTPGPIN